MTSYQSPPIWRPPPVGMYRAARSMPGMAGLCAGRMVRWRRADSSRSDSLSIARDSDWASIRATVVRMARSSGVKVTGREKAAIHAPMVRPATVSGKKAQAVWPGWVSPAGLSESAPRTRVG